MKRCHYCPGGATTRDHRVPRSLVISLEEFLALGRGDAERYWSIRSRNVVPACLRCNGSKGDRRALCDGRGCRRAWERLGPPGWEYLPVWAPPARGLSYTLAEHVGPNWLVH